ncbi:hypothetical protein Mpsy_0641 [Methanolobus psychrophilus R15]|nr:hypothetical protein Mpsy_0641 [Methanolobus psychrophilus R15]
MEEFMKKYKMYELTEQICRAVNEGYNKSRTIYEFLEYSGTYSSFRGSLTKIKKSGYIKFDDTRSSLPKNPFHRQRTYVLTKKGQQFLTNPKERLLKKQERLHNHLMSLLELHPQILQQLSEQRAVMPPEKIIEYVNASVGTNYTDIGQVDQLLEGIKGFKEESVVENPNELDELRRKYNALVLENQKLKNLAVTKYEIPKRNNPPSINQPVESGKNKLTALREELAKEYFNKNYLDIRFFHLWQNVTPVRIKGAKMFEKNSVEFISKSNKEFRRGHAKEMDAEQVFNSCFFIMKIDDDGITIGGKGVSNTGERIKF